MRLFLLSLLAPVFAFGAPSLIRGPYLQSASPTSVVVRWRTDVMEPSMVTYGLKPDQRTFVAASAGMLRDHIVALQDLRPATRYYYAIGATAERPLTGGAEYTFVTPPVAGPAQPLRVWVLGDPGTQNAHQRASRDAAVDHMGDRFADLILLLGDNAYPDGTDAEYQGAIFDMYSPILRTTPLWSTLGNHDGHSANSLTQSGVYYDVFTLPTRGQCGGIPSGTEAYYSFDYANVHFVCLDSHDTDRSSGGAMMTWLEADLAGTRRDWIIAFFHHPTHTKGTHDSDDERDSDGRMRDMRVNFLPVLEAGGVDLVMTGHSHVYERSWLMDGHYGTSETFDAAAHVLGGSDGREDGSGVYRKPAGRPAHSGQISIVAGSSGKTAPSPLNHPAMFISLAEIGSVVLDVDGNRLDLDFVNEFGELRDYFSIVKE